MRRALALALVLAGALGMQAVHAAPSSLRVCADPDNLPFTHEDGSGFENRIAQLVADDLGVPLHYAWLPDRRGFVRKTMGEGLCDLIMGVPAGFERVMTTRPYYRSGYAWVEPANAQLAPASFDDPVLARMRIGVQLVGDDMATTPPGHVFARHGLTTNVVGFPLAGDEPSAARMVRAIAQGRIDGAALWGPQAGYWAAHSGARLRVRMLPASADVPGQRFAFSIAMGVRRGDTALRDTLNAVIERRRADIDAILADYQVPRLPLPEAPR